MDGLRDNIRAAVVLHRPSELDTTVSLACLQEEVLETSCKKDHRRYDQSSTGRSSGRAGVQQPLPPNRPTGFPAAAVNKPDDRRGVEAARAAPVEDQLAVLRAYRRAKNLCIKCRDKWFRRHKCTETVPLHVVEEMWQFLSDQEYIQTATEDSAVQGEEADLCSISRAAVEGSIGPRTIRLQGKIQKKEVLMLIDSGSSHSFVSTNFASQLTGV